MTNSSTWVSVDLQLGYLPPGITDAGVSINGSTVSRYAVGTIAQFRDVGTTQLGTGEFIWLPGVASTIYGSWVSYITSNGVSNAGSTTLWAGTAATPFPLAVATVANTSTTTWAWYQISGAAVCATSGTISAGECAAWQAAGVVQGTAVSTKNVIGAIAMSANGTPATNQAIYLLQRPSANPSTA